MKNLNDPISAEVNLPLKNVELESPRSFLTVVAVSVLACLSLISPSARAMGRIAMGSVNQPTPLWSAVMTASGTSGSPIAGLENSVLLSELRDVSGGQLPEFILKHQNRKFNFRVLEASVDSCRSIRYVAKYDGVVGNEMELILIDHQARTCLDLPANTPGWIATLRSVTAQGSSTETFTGVPLPELPLNSHVSTLDIPLDLYPL